MFRYNACQRNSCTAKTCFEKIKRRTEEFRGRFFTILVLYALEKTISLPASKLGVSEPNPSWFGNDANPVNNPSWTNKNWLKSRFHFSFAEYSNPRNMNFGILRVMNDDLVQPDRGFGTHPHRDAEICTYIVEGELTHKDSMGSAETLGRGGVQFLTAGTGISHSEFNKSKDHPLRFIQIWLKPRMSGLKPNYGSAPGDAAARLNKWAHLVSDAKDTSTATPVKVQQDANIFVTEISPNTSIDFELAKNRQAYLLCMEGAVGAVVNGIETALNRHDAAELVGPLTLQTISKAEGAETAHLLLVEMLATGEGRTDI